MFIYVYDTCVQENHWEIGKEKRSKGEQGGERKTQLGKYQHTRNSTQARAKPFFLRACTCTFYEEKKRGDREGVSGSYTESSWLVVHSRQAVAVCGWPTRFFYLFSPHNNVILKAWLPFLFFLKKKIILGQIDVVAHSSWINGQLCEICIQCFI